MLESGFTRVGEFHYLHHNRDGARFADPAAMSAAIIAAAGETGIALTHLPVFYAHAGFGGAAPSEGQRRFVHDLDSFASLLQAARSAATDLPDAVVGVAPHSLRAVTPDELRVLEALAGSDPIHIHIAEQIREVEDCLAWSGTRPVDWLLDQAQVGSRWCLVHATHMTDRETRRLVASGAVAGLCPITEANLGDGLFPAEAFLEAGGRYGVGSDSNVRIDATEELRLLEYGQRLARRERNQMAAIGRSTGGTLYRSALAGGSQALGGECGICIGAPADLVSLDADHPALIAREGDALLDGLIFAAGRDTIDCVWRRGRKVVSEGRHIARDTIRARYRATLVRLLG
jgi:formiminoglutamate deiminase